MNAEKFCPWDVKELTERKVGVKFCEGESFINAYGKTRALFFEGEPYNGEKTEVFAYMGFPSSKMPLGGFPTVVLVHGGGGAAFYEWVEYWNEKGYAAIALDHSSSMYGTVNLDGRDIIPHNPKGGPMGYNPFGAKRDCYKDEWIYHAVADVILATNVICSDERVNAEKLALTGISWGAVITCIVSGLDSRFKVFAPVYGGGFIQDTPAFSERRNSTQGFEAEKWAADFDPSSYLPLNDKPTLFMMGTNDLAFSVVLNKKSAELCGGKTAFSNRFDLLHYHRWTDERQMVNVFYFIDGVISGRKPPFSVLRAEFKDGKISATAENLNAVKKATLNFTFSDVKEIDSRKWKWEQLSLAPIGANGTVVADVPVGATVCFIELSDGDDKKEFIMSTEFFFL